MHYGLVGTAVGYSPTVLYIGGGIAHFGVTKSGVISSIMSGPPYWGDSKIDHYWIKRGIQYIK